MKNMVQAYAAVDRVPSLHLADIQPSPEDIRQLDLGIFFPTEREIEDFRYNVIQIVC